MDFCYYTNLCQIRSLWFLFILYYHCFNGKYWIEDNTNCFRITIIIAYCVLVNCILSFKIRQARTPSFLLLLFWGRFWLFVESMTPLNRKINTKKTNSKWKKKLSRTESSKGGGITSSLNESKNEISLTHILLLIY